jgi:hypothetical protein
MAIYGKQITRHDIRYIVNEAYIGKTEILLEMEDQINKIRSSLRKFTDIDKSKEVQKLNRLFEKQFGMEVFALHVIQSNTVNAYTIPVNTRFDVALKSNISKMVQGDPNTGYKFKEGNGLGIVCYIYYGLISNPEFTDAEILAVILHELGHNFADAIYNKIKFANKDYARSYYALLIFISILTFGLGIKNIKNNKNKTISKKEKRKIPNPIKGVVLGAKGVIDDFYSFCNEVLARLTGGASWKLSKLGSNEDKQKEYIKTKSLNRQNEVIADKFAGIYGYGPEQVSALLKMDSFESAAEKFTKKIPIFGKIANDSFNNEIKDLCNWDCHPHVIQRAYEEIKTLKAELEKDNLDPKLEKVIREQIDQMEEMIKKATTLVDDAQKSEKCRVEFYKFINDTDRDAVSKEVEDAINQAFDDVLNKK